MIKIGEYENRILKERYIFADFDSIQITKDDSEFGKMI